MSSAICFKLDHSEILLSGNGLNTCIPIFFPRKPWYVFSVLCYMYRSMRTNRTVMETLTDWQIYQLNYNRLFSLSLSLSLSFSICLTICPDCLSVCLSHSLPRPLSQGQNLLFFSYQFKVKRYIYLMDRKFFFLYEENILRKGRSFSIQWQIWLLFLFQKIPFSD